MNGIPEIGDSNNNQYKEYIDEHRENVKRAWKSYQEACKGSCLVYDDWKWEVMNQRVERHDMSKYGHVEFESYRDRFFPSKETKYSDDDIERRFDIAWLHHYTNNDHHPMHWSIFEIEPDDFMLLECILDWEAMSYKFGGNALSYFLSDKGQKEINEECNLSEKVKQNLELMLNEFSEASRR